MAYRMKRGCGPAFKMLGSTPYKQDGIPDPDPPEIETPESEPTPVEIEVQDKEPTPVEIDDKQTGDQSRKSEIGTSEPKMKDPGGFEEDTKDPELSMESGQVYGHVPGRDDIKVNVNTGEVVKTDFDIPTSVDDYDTSEQKDYPYDDTATIADDYDDTSEQKDYDDDDYDRKEEGKIDLYATEEVDFKPYGGGAPGGPKILKAVEYGDKFQKWKDKKLENMPDGTKKKIITSLTSPTLGIKPKWDKKISDTSKKVSDFFYPEE